MLLRPPQPTVRAIFCTCTFVLRAIDRRGRECVDVTGNPGRLTDAPLMRLWAAQDLWIGPGSAGLIDLERIATLPVGEVTRLAPDARHIHLFDPSDEVERIRHRQRTLRDWLGFDRLEAGAGTAEW